MISHALDTFLRALNQLRLISFSCEILSKLEDFLCQFFLDLVSNRVYHITTYTTAMIYRFQNLLLRDNFIRGELIRMERKSSERAGRFCTLFHENVNKLFFSMELEAHFFISRQSTRSHFCFFIRCFTIRGYYAWNKQLTIART